MKHQYFGDVNDYRKYGLLRLLARATGLRLGVCWMLTPGDGRSDGRFVDYMGDAPRWRRYDPELFDSIRPAMPLGRRIDHVAEREMVPAAVFIDEEVARGEVARKAWFDRVMAGLDAAGAELVFFDPDNGIEVPSCPANRKRAAKYVLWREIELAAQSGRSVLVYQHFGREARSGFVARLATELERRTGRRGVLSLRTPHVAYFLIPQPAHRQRCAVAVGKVAAAWPGQIWLADEARPLGLA